MILKTFQGTALIFSFLFLSGCAANMSTYDIPDLPLPESYLVPSGEEAVDSLRWWEAFNSPELNAIEEKALTSLFSDDRMTGNFDLQIALAKLDQSAASLDISTANLFPSLSYSSSVNDSNSETRNNENTSSTYSDRINYSGGLALSYELDLWGKVAAQRQSEEYSYQATYEDLLTVVLTVSSTIANNYINLLSTRAELDILHEQLELNSTLVELQQNRYANGLASSLDILQQQEQLVRSQAEEPILLEQERALLASLSILTGELSTYDLNITATNLPELPPLPQTGIPADLLENRPDIRAAKYALLAADRDLAIADLAFLPTITLGANANLATSALSVLLDNWATSLVASLGGILFDAGTNAARADQADAAARIAVINYVETVTNALNEVDTALKAEQAQVAYLENLNEQLRYERAAEVEAQIQYLNGTDTFLRYITQLQSLQTLERTLIREEAELLRLRVNLYKALGITL